MSIYYYSSDACSKIAKLHKGQDQQGYITKEGMTETRNRLENRLANGLAQFNWKALLYQCRSVLATQEW